MFWTCVPRVTVWSSQHHLTPPDFPWNGDAKFSSSWTFFGQFCSDLCRSLFLPAKVSPRPLPPIFDVFVLLPKFVQFFFFCQNLSCQSDSPVRFLPVFNWRNKQKFDNLFFIELQPKLGSTEILHSMDRINCLRISHDFGKCFASHRIRHWKANALPSLACSQYHWTLLHLRHWYRRHCFWIHFTHQTREWTKSFISFWHRTLACVAMKKFFTSLSVS